MKFFVETDSCGIPYSHYGLYREKNIGTQISSLLVAENGLRAWNAYLRSPSEKDVLVSGRWHLFLKNPENDPTDSDSAEKVITACADWLENNIVPRNDFMVWEYPYQMSYGTPPGWVSGHSQVVGLQLLVRAGRKQHLERLLEALEVSVDDGGIAEFVAPQAIWFEKFAHPDNERPKILNGHLFAVMGLFDIAERLGRSDIHSLAEKGLEAARQLLPQFDQGDWTNYGIQGKPASAHYHDVVVRQLERLVGRAEWVRDWHEKFRAYRKPAKPVA